MLAQSELQEWLRYDQLSGDFVWIKSPAIQIAAGRIAGAIGNHGYREISIMGRKYLAHRLAHLYMLGEFPNGVIDHKNRVRSDNTWLNLRDVTDQVNRCNVAIDSTNKLATRGVTKVGNKYQATLKIAGIQTYLGLFETIADASAIYCETKALFHEGFSNERVSN